MPEVFKFADFELDTAAYTLRHNGASVAIEPLVFDLLVVLVHKAGSVVTRDALINQLWDGRFVSDSTLSTAIKSARKALGDTGDAQRFIRTARGRGFEFVGEIEGVILPAETAHHAQVTLQPALYVRSNFIGDAEGVGPIVHTLETRLRTILGRVPLLRIVTPYRDANEIDNPCDFREQLGCSLILDIQLLRFGSTLQADAKLTETLNGIQQWARSFEVSDSHAGQQVLVHQIIARAEPAIIAAMMSEMDLSEADAPEPLLLQAIGSLSQKGWNQQTFEDAQAMIERVLGIRPDLSLAHAYLAVITALGHRVGILREDKNVVPKAIAAAERALELDSLDSMTLGLSGCALADVGQIDRAIPILKKAIDADPNNGHAKTALGATFMLTRDFKTAVQLLEEGIDLSPADSRLPVWRSVLSMAYLASGQLSAAREMAFRACQDDDRLYMSRLALTAISLAQKDSGAAIVALRQCLRIKPDLHEEEVRRFVGEKLFGKIWKLVLAERKPALTQGADTQ